MNVPATLLLAIPRNSRITRTFFSFPFISELRCGVVRCGVFGCIVWRLFPILWTHYRLKTANKFNGNVNAWKLVCHFRDRQKCRRFLSHRYAIWYDRHRVRITIQKKNTTDDLLLVHELAAWNLRPKSNRIRFHYSIHRRIAEGRVCAYSCLRILVLIDIVVVVVFHFLAQKWRHKFPSNNVNFTSDSLYIFLFFFFLSLYLFSHFISSMGATYGVNTHTHTFGHSQTQRPALLLCERNWMRFRTDCYGPLEYFHLWQNIVKSLWPSYLWM